MILTLSDEVYLMGTATAVDAEVCSKVCTDEGIASTATL